MRMMLNVQIPNEPFNTLARQGKAGDILQAIVEDMKPEAVYFTEVGGLRAVTAIVEVSAPSRVPTIAEPFFLAFAAHCELRIVMSGDDLAKADLAALAEKWGKV